MIDKKDIEIAVSAMSLKDYKGNPERWGEPSNGAVAAVCLATFLFVSAAFVLEALYMAIF